ncbi:hypothetical protein ABID58_005471 [Bradyrhizobium sp. S3.2.6]|uniref:hypothetical protein n=1 Tax=Bradyrhizobium sp. S3.2.6 TaxID=3156428 RepID=UPI00339AF7FF
MGIRVTAAVLLGAFLGGCGLRVPDLQEFPAAPIDGQLMVQSIVTSVHCEIANAVKFVINRDLELARLNHGKRYAEWLETWGVQVSLTLTIEEKSSLNPNAVWLPPTPANSIFTLAGGATVSADATRTDTLNFFYTIHDLYYRKYCQAGVQMGNSPSPLVRSDLKLREWLQAQVGPVATQDISPPSDPGGPLERNAISHEVKFVISTAGDLTPAWTLVQATINQNGALLSASRDRTHDLTITFGPNGGQKLALPALEAHFAKQVGLAVSTNLKGR